MEPFLLPLPPGGQALWLPISWLSIQCWCCGFLDTLLVRFTLSRFLGFSGLRSLKKLRFWCTIKHIAPLCAWFSPSSHRAQSLCQEQRVLQCHSSEVGFEFQYSHPLVGLQRGRCSHLSPRNLLLGVMTPNHLQFGVQPCTALYKHQLLPTPFPVFPHTSLTRPTSP